MSRSSGGRSAVSTISGTRASRASTTAGTRFGRRGARGAGHGHGPAARLRDPERHEAGGALVDHRHAVERSDRPARLSDQRRVARARAGHRVLQPAARQLVDERLKRGVGAVDRDHPSVSAATRRLRSPSCPASCSAAQRGSRWRSGLPNAIGASASTSRARLRRPPRRDRLAGWTTATRWSATRSAAGWRLRAALRRPGRFGALVAGRGTAPASRIATERLGPQARRRGARRLDRGAHDRGRSSSAGSASRSSPASRRAGRGAASRAASQPRAAASSRSSCAARARGPRAGLAPAGRHRLPGAWRSPESWTRRYATPPSGSPSACPHGRAAFVQDAGHAAAARAPGRDRASYAAISSTSTSASASSLTSTPRPGPAAPPAGRARPAASPWRSARRTARAWPSPQASDSCSDAASCSAAAIPQGPSSVLEMNAPSPASRGGLQGLARSAEPAARAPASRSPRRRPRPRRRGARRRACATDSSAAIGTPHRLAHLGQLLERRARLLHELEVEALEAPDGVDRLARPTRRRWRRAAARARSRSPRARPRRARSSSGSPTFSLKHE